MSRIVFLHTAGIDRPPHERSGTDIAVGDLLQEIRKRWETVVQPVPDLPESVWRRHLIALRDGAMPVVVDRLAGCPGRESVVRPGDRIVLADDYAGLLLGRGWKPALLIRHNAFHDSYAKAPRTGLRSRMVLGYHGWLARRFDTWTTRAASAVAAPAGTTELLLRKLVPEAKVLPWRPRVPRRLAGPLPVRDSECLTGVYFANFRYAPNFQSLEFICRTLAPLAGPGVKFRISGPSAQERAAELPVPPNVEICGFQPDLESFVSGCDFGIVPIFQGEGILLKTLSMIGYGMPIVATRKANAGIGLRDGIDAFIADEAPSMIEAISRLQSPDLRAAMGRAAWDAAGRFSDSSGIIEAIEETFERRSGSDGPNPA